MKKRFKYLALREAKNTGAFGHYLTMPVTDKTRTLIIGERLGYLRETAGLSQQDVCEIIGVAKTTYSGYSTSRPVRRFAVLQSCTRLRQTSSLARAL